MGDEGEIYQHYFVLSFRQNKIDIVCGVKNELYIDMGGYYTYKGGLDYEVTWIKIQIIILIFKYSFLLYYQIIKLLLLYDQANFDSIYYQYRLNV